MRQITRNPAVEQTASSRWLAPAAECDRYGSSAHTEGPYRMITPREKAAAGLRVGDSFGTSRALTHDDLVRFADISRDYNPVHFDHRFAKARKFTGPVCHGLLAASLVTELGGQIGWLASRMSFRFKRPVYVGDTVTCTFEITAIDENGRAQATATLMNQDGITVIEAEIGGVVPGEVERRILREMLSEGDPTNMLAHGPRPNHLSGDP